ncbi:RIB43A-like with coiled-coils protein 2 [Styela clava]|uniref:RIB43A-like with coiled-coils protein 2 n=1 Tax=Styela clava TaxID=7725 RepID=UPI0019397078|nr:RIB43A-like with coiled-coils protein 2 [Styela clava]
MYKLDLPLDLKEAAAIESRRKRELERQNRIFNSKTRTIGVDIEALNTQITSRNIREDTEKARDDAFMNDMVRNDKVVMMLQKRQEGDIRRLNQALNGFRLQYQRPETRKEFDLYDPDGKKKDKPARVSDDDPRCGVSGMQKFEGEDLNSKARKKLQNEQLREWSVAQKHEREEAQKQQKYADKLYDMKRVELDQRAIELDDAEKECRRQIEKARKEFNQAQSNERKEKENLNKRQEQDDNFTEISNHVFGDILTENPAVASSSFGSHRVIPDRWKGMTPKQVEEIRRIQEQQRQERRRLREEEWQRDMEWDRQRVAMARAATILERQENNLQKGLRQEQDLANIRLAAEQSAHKNFLDTEVYVNPPTAQYFAQFNTSSR